MKNCTKKNKVTPWSHTIQQRRLSWLGHLLRLNEETPAKIALREALQPQPRTWLQTIKNDITELNIVQTSENEKIDSIIKKVKNIAQDRDQYRSIIKSCMSPRGRPNH